MTDAEREVIERNFYTLQRLERAGLLLPTEKRTLEELAKMLAEKVEVKP